MDVREKLVDMIFDSLCRHIDKSCKLAENIADDLLSSGVTVQKWIPVNERLPEHGDVVMVWHTYMEHPFVCQWDERSDCWIDNKWAFGRNTITHWCRLPHPPKGE